MTRPLRLEFPGALYHVTTRGNRHGSIYRDDEDRRTWISMLRETCARCNFFVHAYCQMTNHYHLLLETPDGNLSAGMRQLNGVFAQYVNRRHGLAGHLFQGRYKAILVQKESYLLELSRYVLLNPVRAGIVATPDEWDWSSYRWMVTSTAPPPWLHTDWLLSQFGDGGAGASEAFRLYVQAGFGMLSPLERTRYQLILGDADFVACHRDKAPLDRFKDISKAQRRQSSMSLREYESCFHVRDEAMARAFWSTAFSMAEIGDYFGVSYKTVGRAVRRYEAELSAGTTD